MRERSLLDEVERPGPLRDETLRAAPQLTKILYSREEAAVLLSLSLSSIQELLHRGLLRGVRKGRLVLIHRDELERFASIDTPEIWLPKQNGRSVRSRRVA